MRANVPREYCGLSPAQRRRLDVVVQEQIDHEEAEMQKIWLQYACIVLHRMFGLGRKRLLYFLAGWRNMYYQNSKMNGSEEQAAFLKEYMDKLFGKDGYPYEWVDQLEHLYD